MRESDSEHLSRPEIEALQLQRLRRLVDEIGGRNAFWSARLAAAGLRAESLQLDDLRSLPFTTKQELVDDQNAHLPYGSNLTYPTTAYSRLHQTSGTTGRPMRWLDTPQSWDWFMECWAQIYRIIGLRPDDVLAFPFSFGPFVGFWAAFDGAVRRGNLCIPMGGMSSEARLRLIEDLDATLICCTPTYALRLAEVAQQLRMNLADGPVRGILVAGEPGGTIPAVRRRIETAWGARVFDHWGMTDLGSLGIEPEAAPGGLSLLETECIAEIVDPPSGMPVAPGEMGELIMTNLGRWGQPVLRYRTGDLVRAAVDPCPSGLSLVRLEGGILGRADDMVTIRGNNVFPSSIEAILREFETVAEFRITVETRRSMPQLRIEIEPSAEAAASSAEVDALLHAISRAIKDRLNFQPELVPVEVDGLPRFELKGRRFIRP